MYIYFLLRVSNIAYQIINFHLCLNFKHESIFGGVGFDLDIILN